MTRNGNQAGPETDWTGEHGTYDEIVSRALDVFERVNQDIPLRLRSGRLVYPGNASASGHPLGLVPGVRVARDFDAQRVD
jgi:hypothetical protein